MIEVTGTAEPERAQELSSGLESLEPSSESKVIFKRSQDIQPEESIVQDQSEPEEPSFAPESPAIESLPSEPKAEPSSPEPALDPGVIEAAREQLKQRYDLRRKPKPNYKAMAKGIEREVLRIHGKRALRKIKIKRSDIIAILKYEYGLRISAKKGLQLYPQLAHEAIFKELKQLVDMATFEPVDSGNIDPEERRKAIRSFMFLKEKYDSTGRFEKIKARMVGSGDMQDKSLYQDETSSPTASTTAIMMSLAIAAKEKRKVVTIDVPGAYLHSSLKPDAPHPLMIIDPDSSKILCEIKPEWSQFLRKDGSVMVRLNKGLYGLVESAKLWNENITTALSELGFSANPLDPCTLNSGKGNSRCTINIHVDDLLISCKDEKVIKSIEALIIKKYGGCTLHEGIKLSYLGLTLDFSSEGLCEVSMGGYIEDWLSSAAINGKAATPALDDLFDIDEDSPLLSADDKKFFHCQVAKALYAAKRARPDLGTAVAFLSTRVTKSTEQDMTKLLRLLRYVNGTKDLTLTLGVTDPIKVVDFVDASFAVHPDRKSHGGSCVSLGTGFFYTKSSKQKLMTKSSTEAELVALSDHYSQAVWCAEFLKHQGHPVGPAIVCQDNQSTMALIKKGRSTSDRTRHVDIRYFFIKDRIDSGEVKVVYCNTKEMVADILTKPLQGEAFRKLRDLLMGKATCRVFSN
jgi:hypothetical protein